MGETTEQELSPLNEAEDHGNKGQNPTRGPALAGPGSDSSSKSDAISEKEAEENAVLIQEDICKYKQLQAQLRVKIAEYDAYIAECETALADVQRRKAGVMYPVSHPAK